MPVGKGVHWCAPCGLLWVSPVAQSGERKDLEGRMENLQDILSVSVYLLLKAKLSYGKNRAMSVNCPSFNSPKT